MANGLKPHRMESFKVSNDCFRCIKEIQKYPKQRFCPFLCPHCFKTYVSPIAIQLEVVALDSGSNPTFRSLGQPKSASPIRTNKPPACSPG